MADETYGQLIRRRRTELKLSQPQLGRMVQEDGSTISRWETGKRKPTIEQANRLIRALEIPSEPLLRAIGVRITPQQALDVIPDELLYALLAMTDEQRRALIPIADALARVAAP